MARGGGNTYVCFDTVVFGGGGSPLIWGRAAAWLARSGQSLFEFWELLIELYVDDPHFSILGEQNKRRRLGMILFLWWQAIGLKLAFHKTERGLVVDWIGARITIQADWSVKVALPDKMITELLSECNEMLKLRTVGLRRLRKFVGRCSWAAGLVQELAPFLASCWAAIAESVAQGPEQRQGFVQLVTNETARRKRRRLDDLRHEDMTVGVDLNESAVMDEVQEEELLIPMRRIIHSVT